MIQPEAIGVFKMNFPVISAVLSLSVFFFFFSSDLIGSFEGTGSDFKVVMGVQSKL